MTKWGKYKIVGSPDEADLIVELTYRVEHSHGYAPAILKLPPGKHFIQLVRQGYKDWTSNVDVREIDRQRHGEG